MNQDDAPVRPGDILAGKYRVEKVLGVGAMGVVVATMHVDLQERRALKFMLPGMLGDAEGVERFMREARAAVRLKSQHVAKVHDIGRLDTGAPYIVMEYLDGTDLKAMLEARGRLSVMESAGYLMQACEAIAEAHALGIIHRDLKPANLFLTRGVGGATCIKVLDFGIAKVQGAELDMTGTTAMLGSPLYMSPEQVRSARSVDTRTDIWALGAILYRMLTGKTPFSGSTVTEICAGVLAEAPEAPAKLRPDVPPALDAIVMRCLDKNPAKRFATATELSAALGPFASGQALAAAQQAHAQQAPAPPPSSSGPRPLALGGTERMDPRQAEAAMQQLKAAQAAAAVQAPAAVAAVQAPAAPAPPVVAAPMPAPAPAPQVAPVAPAALPPPPKVNRARSAPPRSSKGPLLIGVVLGLVILGVGAAIMNYGAKSDQGSAAPGTATATATAQPGK